MRGKIQFANEKVKAAFEKLDKGDRDEKQLRKYIERAFDDICENPFCGIQVPKRLIPKDYLKKFDIKNVWKYNLPNAWRLIYSIIGGKLYVLTIVLEWMNHKEYERRFKY